MSDGLVGTGGTNVVGVSGSLVNLPKDLMKLMALVRAKNVVIAGDVAKAKYTKAEFGEWVDRQEVSAAAKGSLKAAIADDRASLLSAFDVEMILEMLLFRAHRNSGDMNA